MDIKHSWEKVGFGKDQIDMSEDRQYEWGVLIFFSVVSVIIMMKSPLNPFYWGKASVDSSVFKYVALVMSKGGMPYKDVFDHKGPLIYILNYIGQLISYYRGTWVIEILFMVSLMLVLYKTARLLCNKFTSVAIVLLCCSLLNIYFEEGNLTEEYAMVFIASGIYIFMDYFLNNKISKLRLVICGICFGAVVLLRVNMVSVWVVFSLAVLFQSIQQKDKKWISFLIWFLVGTAFIVIPILIWLAVNGALGDFFNDYLFFNLKYTSDPNYTSISNRYDSLIYFGGNSLVLGSIILLVYSIGKKKDVFVNTVYLLGIFFSLISISISGRSYGHYGMVLIPLLVYPYAQIYSPHFNSKNFYERLTMSIILLLLTISSWKDIGKTAVTKYYNYTQGDTDSLSEEEKEVISIIEKNIEEDERIMVLGGQDIWYVLSNRLSASKYSYQFNYMKEGIYANILNEVLEDMVTKEPSLVVVTEGYEYLFPNIEDYESIYIDNEHAITVYIHNVE